MSGLLGIVLARRDDLALVVGLAAAARAAGHPVALFAMAEGVVALADPAHAAAIATLRDADCELVACATSVDQRGLVVPAAVQLGSQDDHAALVARAARLVALT
jgi:sulfur relay (sulfurtransferase) complex TusBCD TusD component (DsrE family)